MGESGSFQKYLFNRTEPALSQPVGKDDNSAVNSPVFVLHSYGKELAELRENNTKLKRLAIRQKGELKEAQSRLSMNSFVNNSII